MSEQLQNALLNLSSSDPRARESALDVLRADPPATLAFLIEQLRTNQHEGWRALCALQYVKDKAAAALPEVVPFVRDSNRVIRRVAVEAIAQMGPAARSAVPQLLAALDDNYEAVGRRALAALLALGLGPADSAAIQPLERLLLREIRVPDPRGKSVAAAARLLQSIGPQAALPLVNALKTVLQRADCCENYDDFEYEFLPLFEALAAFSPDSHAAVHETIELLRDDDAPEQFRAQLAVTLRAWKAYAADLVPALVEVGKREDGQSKLFDAVRYALQAIGPPAVAPLVAILSPRAEHSVPPDETSRCFAAAMLGDFSRPEYPAERNEPLAHAARGSIPRLMSAFAQGGAELRMACGYALGKMGADALSAVPLLTGALTDEDRFVREAARHALWMITDTRP
jgi:hypothetical protein